MRQKNFLSYSKGHIWLPLGRFWPAWSHMPPPLGSWWTAWGRFVSGNNCYFFQCQVHHTIKGICFHSKEMVNLTLIHASLSWHGQNITLQYANKFFARFLEVTTGLREVIRGLREVIFLGGGSWVTWATWGLLELFWRLMEVIGGSGKSVGASRRSFGALGRSLGGHLGP